MTETTILDSGEQALREGAAFMARPDAGLLVLTDDDCADFLHRMTTNEINHLAAGKATVTVLTSPTARILQVFTVLARSDAFWLLPAPGAAAALAHHLRGQIFFMDKVKVANLSEEYRRLRLLGPQAKATLSTIAPEVAALPDGDWCEVTLTQDAQSQDTEPIAVTILQQLDYELPGYELITATANFALLQEQLQAAGCLAIDESTYHMRRVELGRPAAAHELTEEYNPLEAGIGWTCADNKGCYTGQEIIARQITYDKITKVLVGLRSDTKLAEGSELQTDGRVVGHVTSSTMSSQLGTPLALAIVRRPYHEAGTSLDAGGQDVTVTALPMVG